MKKTIKNYSQKINDNDFKELLTITRYYTNVKNEIFNRYGSINGLQYIGYPRQVRDEWVKTKYADKFNLQARYWKLALEEAFTNIKSNWTFCFNDVRKAIYRNKYLSEDEKIYCYYMLKAPELLYKIIIHKQFKMPDKLKEFDVKPNINNWLRTKVRKYQRKKPYCTKANNFMLDSRMYRYSDNILYIMGLKLRKRISVKMINKLNCKGNIRIILKDNNTIIVCQTKNVETKQNWDEEKIISVDKGFTELIHTSEDKIYGEQLGGILKKESNRLSEKNKKRNKLFALLKNYEIKDNNKKANNIKKYNLGRVKYNIQKQSKRSKMESYINQSLNIFFKEDTPSLLITENLNFSNGNKKLSKKVKRYFSNWLKGYIQKRIEFKSNINKVTLAVVNPAYTSQICSNCGFLDSSSRNGDIFHCPKCGKHVNVDYNASLNLLNRYFDKEIGIYTPYKKVKQILLDRFKASVVGSSNATGTTRTPDTLIPDKSQSESELQIEPKQVCIDLYRVKGPVDYNEITEND